jgi:hypothetical protein
VVNLSTGSEWRIVPVLRAAISVPQIAVTRGIQKLIAHFVIAHTDELWIKFLKPVARARVANLCLDTMTVLFDDKHQHCNNALDFRARRDHEIIGQVAPCEAQRRCFIVVLCCGFRLAKPLVEIVFADAGIATRSRETPCNALDSQTA